MKFPYFADITESSGFFFPFFNVTQVAIIPQEIWIERQ
jgi:hypothetical protein